MYLGKQLGVVVPAYNEAGHVGRVIEDLPAIVDRAYVVDDASTDGTWAEIRAAIETTSPASVPPDAATVDVGAATDGGTRDDANAAGEGDSTVLEEGDATDVGEKELTDVGERDATAAGESDPTHVGERDATGVGGSGTDAPRANADGDGPERAGLDAWRAVLDSGTAAERTGVAEPRPEAAPGSATDERPVDAPSGADDGDGGVGEGGLLSVLPTDARVVGVRHAGNRGRGAAVATGYRLALADGMDVVAVMDGDGQMDPDALHRIVHPVATGRVDYAKGNRLAGRAFWRGMSRWRLFGNVMLTVLTRVSSGYWRLSDPQNGYTAVSRSALRALPLSSLYPDYGFLNDVLVHLNLDGARVADVAQPALYGEEESGIRLVSFVPNASRLLAANFLRRVIATGRRRGTHEVTAAYAVALLTWLATGVALAVALLGTAATDGTVGVVPTAVLAGGATIASLAAVWVDWRANAGLLERVGPGVPG